MLGSEKGRAKNSVEMGGGSEGVERRGQSWNDGRGG